MKTALIIRKLIIAGITLVILVYFAIKTTSPKIIFAPFLICSVAGIGKYIGMLFNQLKLALFFDRLFKIVFFLSWFIFLIFACCFSIREGRYEVVLFTLPLWLGGIFFAKRKLFKKKDR